MSFFVRRLQPGDVFRARTDHEEAAFVLLGGICQVDWGQGAGRIGKRKNVFDGFPYALYLPAGKRSGVHRRDNLRNRGMSRAVRSPPAAEIDHAERRRPAACAAAEMPRARSLI